MSNRQHPDAYKHGGQGEAYDHSRNNVYLIFLFSLSTFKYSFIKKGAL